MKARDLAHEAQSKSGTRRFGLTAIKRLENLLAFFGHDTFALVRNFDRAVRAKADHDLTPTPANLDGVAHEVCDRPFDGKPVGNDDDGGTVAVEGEIVPCVDRERRKVGNYLPAKPDKVRVGTCHDDREPLDVEQLLGDRADTRDVEKEASILLGIFVTFEERWDTELEAERSALARSILGIVPGDIVTSESRGKLLRLSVTGVTLYSGGSSVSFMVSGIRFRKDGTLGKLQETLNLSFIDERQAQK